MLGTRKGRLGTRFPWF